MIPKAFTALAKMKLIFVLTIVKEPLGMVGYAAYHMYQHFFATAYLIQTRKPSNAKKYSIETAEELFNLYSPYTRKLRDLG